MLLAQITGVGRVSQWQFRIWYLAPDTYGTWCCKQIIDGVKNGRKGTSGELMGSGEGNIPKQSSKVQNRIND